MSLPYHDYRCAGCKKLLFKGWLAEGEVEIKCKGCGGMTKILESKFDEMLCAILPCPHRIAPSAKALNSKLETNTKK